MTSANTSSEISSNTLQDKPSSWLKRLIWVFIGCVAVLLVGALALRVFITTNSGAKFIESQINKRAFGPIEGITVTGLSGDPLKALSIDSLSVRDKDGIWLTLNDLDMTWKPLAFLKGHVWIQDLSIDTTQVIRRPQLNSVEEGDPLKFTAEQFDFLTIKLNESLLGQNLEARASGQFVARSDGPIKAVLNAERLDQAGDSLTLDFDRSATGDMRGIFDVKGVSNGPLATLLKVPDNTPLSGSGDLNGTPKTGEGNATLTFGTLKAVTATANWSEDTLNLESIINAQAWPDFEAVKQRLGADLQSTLTVNRLDVPQSFQATVNVPNLSLKANGILPDDGYRPTQANIEVNAKSVSSFIDLPEGYSIERASANGQVGLTEPYKFEGRIALSNIATPQGTTSEMTGPLSVFQNGESGYGFNTDMTLLDISPTNDIPIDLAKKTQVKASGQLDLDKERITFDRLSLKSGKTDISAQGRVALDGARLDLKGRGTAVLNPIGSLPSGQIKADFTLKKTAQSFLALTTDGAFKPTSTIMQPVSDLIGEQVVFQADMEPVSGGLKISEARVIGENIKAGIEGTIGDTLSLSGETVVSGDLTYKTVTINDGAEASFTLTGPSQTPKLRLDAEIIALTAQGRTIDALRVRTEVSDILQAPKGPLQIEGQTEYGPLAISTDFASTTEALIADDIQFSLGRLAASGRLAYPQDGIVIGELSLNLPEKESQFAKAELTLSNASGEQGVALSAQAEAIELSGFQFDSFALDATGTLASLTGELSAEGQRGETLIARRFSVEAPFTLAREEEELYRLQTSPKALYGDIAVSAASPISAQYQSSRLLIEAPLNVADGSVILNYQRETDQEGLKLTAANLPVTLISMPGNLADTRGRISADISLSTLQRNITGDDITADGSAQRRALNGNGTIKLSNWRGFDIAKTDGLTATVELLLNGTSARANLQAQSSVGFSADGTMDFALLPANNLTDLRLNMDAPVNGGFQASGAAAAILGLVTPSEAQLGGSLSANIDISGTAQAPQVKGQAGGRDIQFEAPELGTRIQDGRFTANFTNDTLSVDDVFVTDASTGSLSGQGNFKLGELGRPVGTLTIQAKNFEALDRRDVKAQVNGKLDFVTEQDSAKLSGDITIKRAELKQFVSSAVGVVEIEVEEINRPKNVSETTFKPVETTPIDLDVRIRAPRQIYVRSRGIDMEMSIDATIKGTLTDPLFYGEANILRGGYKLAGKTLDFEVGTIRFDGDLASARVNFKAVTETQNLDATIAISGTVKDPKFELTSAPERPQDEILSALLFGRSATELSAIEAAQLAGALAQISGVGGGFDLLGGLRDAIGIGQLSVNFNPDGSAQLVGGRYLARNVYLKVFSGAGPDQTGAIIDWEIRKNIALRSRIRADNDQALSLKWKRDF